MFGPGRANPRAQNVLESLTVLSYVAGLTSSVRLRMTLRARRARRRLGSGNLRASLNMSDAKYTHAAGDAPFAGDQGRVLDGVHRRQDVGLEYLVLSVAANDSGSTIDSIRWFAEQVLPVV